MKILAIGNSFSQDATAYVEDIAASLGREDIIAANLYIGGCPLSRHAENLRTNAKDYEYQRHGKEVYKACIRETLEADKWDVITLQQVSGLSGIEGTYHPYLEQVLDVVRTVCPDAKIMLHRTWAYEEGSGHGDFPRYDRDRVKMDTAIEAVYQNLSKTYGFEIIPSGNFVTFLKSEPEFDIANGGISLYRDRFHMSYTYGRYATAAVWLKVICGMTLDGATFVPEGSDAALTQKINLLVDKTF